MHVFMLVSCLDSRQSVWVSWFWFLKAVILKYDYGVFFCTLARKLKNRKRFKVIIPYVLLDWFTTEMGDCCCYESSYLYKVNFFFDVFSFCRHNSNIFPWKCFRHATSIFNIDLKSFFNMEIKSTNSKQKFETN